MMKMITTWVVLIPAMTGPNQADQMKEITGLKALAEEVGQNFYNGCNEKKVKENFIMIL